MKEKLCKDCPDGERKGIGGQIVVLCKRKNPPRFRFLDDKCIEEKEV